MKAISDVPVLSNCPYVFWNSLTGTRYQRINETFSRARKKAGLDHIQLKDFRCELGIVLAESGQPLHVAQTQLGHSSIRTTEKFYTKFSPEFAVSRARDVLENRGRQVGDTPQEPPPAEEPPKPRPVNLLDFQQLREMSWRRRADSNR